jgi:hypothetical protein
VRLLTISLPREFASGGGGGVCDRCCFASTPLSLVADVDAVARSSVYDAAVPTGAVDSSKPPVGGYGGLGRTIHGRALQESQEINLVSDSTDGNVNRHGGGECTNDVTGEFPRAGYYVLSNGDTAWTSSMYQGSCGSTTSRDLAQAFDGNTHGGWGRSFHGACHSGDDWRTTSIRVRYSWQTNGNGLTQGVPNAEAQQWAVSSVSVFQSPGGHQTGRVEVHYLALDGTIQPVGNPSTDGFGNGDTAEGFELQINFDAIETSMIEVQMWAHDNTNSDICVGASEIQIYGSAPVADADCAGTWSCSAACEAAVDRTWIETTPQAGTGAACPVAASSDCANGDGSCVVGCTNPAAQNYVPGVEIDDGSCICDPTAAFRGPGAYTAGSNTAACPACSGDMDGDMVVGTRDLLLLLSDFDLTDCRLISDANGDCVVNTPDLLALLAAFGTDCIA